MITYRLSRWSSNDKGTLGELYRSDELICFTLEPPPNVPEPCIPVGTYKLLWEQSPSLGRLTPRLDAVPNRTGILIHAGNTIKDTKGCILVGSGWTANSDGIFLNNSAVMRDQVYQLVGYDLGGGGFAEIDVEDQCRT